MAEDSVPLKNADSSFQARSLPRTQQSISPPLLVDISQSPPNSPEVLESQDGRPCIFGCSGFFTDLENHIAHCHPDTGWERNAQQNGSAHADEENVSSQPAKRRCTGVTKISAADQAFLEKISEVVKRHLETSDDPLSTLREISQLVNYRCRNKIYESSVDDGKGYCESYLLRLQELMKDSSETNVVLMQVGNLLHIMDDGKVEYQMPKQHIVNLIQLAAANGKQVPTLHLATNVRFYGRDLGDAGWGCGYRNAQMLIAALLDWLPTNDRMKPEIDSFLNQARCPTSSSDSRPPSLTMPNISALQGLLQQAWARGFSQNAAVELDAAVVETSKWIGTTEIQALFSSMKIECYIKDYSHGSVPVSFPPNKLADARALRAEIARLQKDLFAFVQSYFVGSADLPPLYIQDPVHSRTIIGVDLTAMANPDDPKLMDKVGLLILDPANTQWDIDLRGNPTRKWYHEKVFCAMSSFREPMYQILYFTGKILDDVAYQRMKLAGEGHDNFQLEEFEDYSHLL